MDPKIKQSFDANTGVLYVLREGSTPVICDHDRGDMDVILSLDDQNKIIGVTLLDADLLDRNNWLAHPSRRTLPEDIKKVVDRWVSTRVNE